MREELYGKKNDNINGVVEWWSNGLRYLAADIDLNNTSVDEEIAKCATNKTFHRIDGPAVISEKYMVWMQRGIMHRTDGPAFEFVDGNKYWYQNGKRHRTDGPAIERNDGSKFWYQNGKYHRLDGPAIEWADGSKYWYQNGNLHHTDGPAIIFENPFHKFVYISEKNKNEDFTRRSGNYFWFIDGNELTDKEFSDR